MRQGWILIAGTALSACTSQHPSHIPPLVTLPAHAISTAVQNAAYNTRRAAVKTYISDHHSKLMSEIAHGRGPHLQKLLRLAPIKAPKRAVFLQSVQSALPLYSRSIEALTVAVMVHSN